MYCYRNKLLFRHTIIVVFVFLKIWFLTDSLRDLVDTFVFRKIDLPNKSSQIGDNSGECGKGGGRGGGCGGGGGGGGGRCGGGGGRGKGGGGEGEAYNRSTKYTHYTQIKKRG